MGRNKWDKQVNTYGNNYQVSEIDLQNKTWEEYLSEARALYQGGVAGDTNAARQALRLLESLNKKLPNNNLIKAYYGGAYILKAREETNLVNKGKISHQGMNILDSALSKEPDNIEIRIVHAYVCKYLPDWLNRGVSAIEDFQYLCSRYEADPTVFNESFYRQIQSDIAEIQKQLGAIPPHVQKIYDSFSNMAKKKKQRGF